MHAGPSTLLLVALLLSGAGLMAGPLILSLGRGRAAAGALVEGLALGLVPTMVLLRLLPHVAESLGGIAIALFAAAFLVLRAFDRAHHRAAARLGRAFIYSALLLHSFTDGVGLAAAISTPGIPSQSAVDVTLTVAFVIHRLPEGLFIATTLLPSYGWRRTIVRTLGLFAATVAGGLLGGALLPLLSERLFDAVVAVGLGAMLQLVLHSHAERAKGPATRALTSLALVAGVATALLVPAPGDLLAQARAAELPVARSLAPLFVHAAPAVLVAVVLAALLHALVRASAPTRGVLDGVLFALFTPVGPAQVLPAARGLSLQGATRATATAFLLAATALTLDGALVSARLLGPLVATAQLAGAALLALLGGLACGGTRTGTGVVFSTGRDLRTFGTLLLRGLDQAGPPLLVGLVFAAGIEAAVDPAWLAEVGPYALLLVLPLGALLVGASPLTLAPLAAVLLHKGVPTDAVLALLVAGPVGGRARLALVAETSASRALFLACGWALSTGLALLLARLVPDATPALHAWADAPAGVAELVCAVVLALLFGASLVRLGPDLWFGQLVVDPPVPEHHDHDHHEHAHTHP